MGPPAMARRVARAARTLSWSWPMLPTMSAKMVGSSAPGTSYFVLAGMIMPARQRRSSRSAFVRGWSVMAGSIEQGCETLLHRVGDVEREGLDRAGGVHAA